MKTNEYQETEITLWDSQLIKFNWVTAQYRIAGPFMTIKSILLLEFVYLMLR